MWAVALELDEVVPCPGFRHCLFGRTHPESSAGGGHARVGFLGCFLAEFGRGGVPKTPGRAELCPRGCRVGASAP